MNACCDSRFFRPAGLCSFGFLDVPQGVRLRRLTCEKSPAGFGLDRLATAFPNNPSVRRL